MQNISCSMCKKRALLDMLKEMFNTCNSPFTVFYWMQLKGKVSRKIFQYISWKLSFFFKRRIVFPKKVQWILEKDFNWLQKQSILIKCYQNTDWHLTFPHSECSFLLGRECRKRRQWWCCRFLLDKWRCYQSPRLSCNPCDTLCDDIKNTLLSKELTLRWLSSPFCW